MKQNERGPRRSVAGLAVCRVVDALLHLGKLFITFITEFCVALGGDEEFFGFVIC